MGLNNWFAKISFAIRGRSREVNFEESREKIAEESVPISTDLFGVTTAGERPANEDSILTVSTDAYHLIAVADGLGGHAAGEYASEMAICMLESEVAFAYHDQMDIPDIELMLEDIYTDIHEAIESEGIGEREGMGTTLVSALIRKNRAFIAHTGDSRAYLVREGVIPLTKDHSVVQSLIDEGTIDAEKARVHPLRNVLTHAMGGSFNVKTRYYDLNDGDLLLLCSDGFSGFVREEAIPGAVGGRTAEGAVKRLVKMAEEGESDDNISVILYRHGLL